MFRMEVMAFGGILLELQVITGATIVNLRGVFKYALSVGDLRSLTDNR